MTESLDLDALEASIHGAYDLCHVRSDDVLALIGRVREAEREMHARELHHFEEEQARAKAEAVIERVVSILRQSGTDLNAVNKVFSEIDNYRRALGGDQT